MKIFISWSGERSKALAHVLREFLPAILQFTKPWLSAMDIEAGERWSDVIAQELATTNFGILCVTSENKGAPWMLFEAGALAKSIEKGRVIPLLLDVDNKDLQQGPLTMYQTKRADRTGLLDIVKTINNLHTEPVTPGSLDLLADALLPNVEKQITGIEKLTAPAKVTRKQDDILEELVSTVRSLDSRIEDLSSSVRYISTAPIIGERVMGGRRLDSEQMELKTLLMQRQSLLSQRDRDVLRLRYGLDDGIRRTGREVGELFALTQGRISQIEAEALQKIGWAESGNGESSDSAEYIE